MRSGRAVLFVAVLWMADMPAAVPAPDLTESPSWYYHESTGWHEINVLTTCVGETTIFRTLGFKIGVPVSELPEFREVIKETCRVRDELLGAGVFSERSLFGRNKTLSGLISQQSSCSTSADLNETQKEACRQAYFGAIDWLLGTGVDINGGELGTVLNGTVVALNEEMFYFLLSRGADPTYRPPGAEAYSGATPEIKNLVDTIPRSAIEYLELHLSNLDESEFPEVAKAWRRMHKRAIEWENPGIPNH